MLLVSDEVICAYGRLGTMFGAQKYGYQPDIITSAKGLTSGYSPLGAAIISDRIFEPFGKGDTVFPHGYTFGGHPVSCAVALANLDLFEREDLLGNVLRNENAFRQTLEKLLDLPIVGDVRGDGYFYGIELVKDKATKETFDAAESERILRGYVSGALFETGLYCRADDRGDPVVQVAPPLICGQPSFDEIEQKPPARAERGLEAGLSRPSTGSGRVACALNRRVPRPETCRVPRPEPVEGRQTQGSAGIDSNDMASSSSACPSSRRPNVRSASSPAATEEPRARSRPAQPVAAVLKASSVNRAPMPYECGRCTKASW